MNKNEDFYPLKSYFNTLDILKPILKGNEALEKKNSPRQGNMERKSKLKKKKIPLFRPHKRLFGSAESELNGGERSVFEVINAVSKQLIEVLKCVYDVTNSENISAHNF